MNYSFNFSHNGAGAKLFTVPQPSGHNGELFADGTLPGVLRKKKKYFWINSSTSTQRLE